MKYDMDIKNKSLLIMQFWPRH
uniref:Uncharacterized protein n=1 Tax=Arundo donax TaxID=35708 RepID=A0A0A9H6Q4_ARUDO